MSRKGELQYIGVVDVAGEEEAKIRIFPEFCDALKGIDGFSHYNFLLDSSA